MLIIFAEISDNITYIYACLSGRSPWSGLYVPPEDKTPALADKIPPPELIYVKGSLSQPGPLVIGAYSIF